MQVRMYIRWQKRGKKEGKKTIVSHKVDRRSNGWYGIIIIIIIWRHTHKQQQFKIMETTFGSRGFSMNGFPILLIWQRVVEKTTHITAKKTVIRQWTLCLSLRRRRGIRKNYSTFLVCFGWGFCQWSFWITVELSRMNESIINRNTAAFQKNRAWILEVILYRRIIVGVAYGNAKDCRAERIGVTAAGVRASPFTYFVLWTDRPTDSEQQDDTIK